MISQIIKLNPRNISRQLRKAIFGHVRRYVVLRGSGGIIKKRD